MRGTEGSISKLEDKTVETTLHEQQRKSRLKKWTESQGLVRL